MHGNLGRAPPELTFFDMRAVVLMSSVFDLVRYSEFPDESQETSQRLENNSWRLYWNQMDIIYAQPRATMLPSPAVSVM